MLFIIVGVKYLYFNLVFVLYVFVVDFVICFKILGICFLSFGLNSFIVFFKIVLFVIILNLVLEFKILIFIINGFRGFIFLLIIDCRFIIIVEFVSIVLIF